MTRCRYHCRPCGRHFTSLSGFDSHRSGKPGSRVCGEPDSSIPVNVGECDISEEETLKAVKVYGGAEER